MLSVAIDAQSADVPRRFVEQAGATFTTVIDQANVLSDLYGFKAIPNGYLIDEQGVVSYCQLGGFDIRGHETAKLLERWVSGDGDSLLGQGREAVLDANHAKANIAFRQGLADFEAGRVEAALAHWRRARGLDPDNYLIRKQIWAVEHPEKFYEGEVDYDWQAQQMARES